MKNILIIDDEEKLRGLLARIVKSEGFDVIEAPDLKSGFKKMEQNDIDINYFYDNDNSGNIKSLEN